MSSTQDGPHEDTVRAYFEQGGWTVSKLKTGTHGSAADFRICKGGACFLCEVKTVLSTRADFPYRPIDFARERQRRDLDTIRQHLKGNPDVQLLLRKDQHEFLSMGEANLERKFGRLPRHTQPWFRLSAASIAEYLTTVSSVKDLPYTVQIDCQDLYVPNDAERAKLYLWLECEIRSLAAETPGRHWHLQPFGEGAAMWYSVYVIHYPAGSGDRKREWQVTVRGPNKVGGLEVCMPTYGTLNLSAIWSRVEDGLKQLQASASREEDSQIPRMLALALGSSIWPDECGDLLRCIAQLQEEHSDLSVIAILSETAGGPFPTSYMASLFKNLPTAEEGTSFVVIHSSWLEHVRPIPPEAFSDRRSTQFCPIRETSRASNKG